MKPTFGICQHLLCHQLPLSTHQSAIVGQRSIQSTSNLNILSTDGQWWLTVNDRRNIVPRRMHYPERYGRVGTKDEEIRVWMEKSSPIEVHCTIEAIVGIAGRFRVRGTDAGSCVA